MNILIVGNGFDLSHYLPTKYDHFMMAMGAIEKWDIANGEMSFDDLFGSFYEKEDYFFGYTKAMYDTDQIKISVEQITKLKKQLEENVWYQYFSDHVREVKTWIDFETKIKSALEELFIFFKAIEDVAEKDSKYSLKIMSKDGSSGIFINRHCCRILELLGLLTSQYYKFNAGVTILCGRTTDWVDVQYEINKEFIQENKIYNKFKFDKVEKHLQFNLNNFSILFNDYLLFINKVFDGNLVTTKPNVGLFKMSQIEKVFSFNYTKTFNKLYGTSEIDFLHGEMSEIKSDINLVLGISSLDKNYLSKYKLYGFLKYHQKLLNNTDYLFLDDSTKLFEEIKRSSQGFGYTGSFDFYIWGHSLDISDEQYIKELFSFNEEKDQKVRVIVFYFNQQAKFDLLANLLEILDKDLVEKWMKKGWLKFEPNPDIVELNNIEPVELPKIAEA